MDNNSLVNKIRILAKQKGVTLKETLVNCELSKSFIYDIEKRNIAPSFDRLQRLADYFSVSVDYLLGNTDNKEKTSDNTKIVISDEDIKFALFNGNKEITDEMYEEVKQFAQFVINRKKNGNNKDLRDSRK